MLRLHPVERSAPPAPSGAQRAGLRSRIEEPLLHLHSFIRFPLRRPGGRASAARVATRARDARRGVIAMLASTAHSPWQARPAGGGSFLAPPPRPNEFGPTQWLRIGCVLTLALLLGGCEKTFENMYDQPRYKPLAPSPLWADGRSSRTPVDETVAHSEGSLADSSSGRLGQVASEPEEPSENDNAQRRTWTLPFLERGQQRFGIFCAPC